MKTLAIGKFEDFVVGEPVRIREGKISLVAVRCGDDIRVLADRCSHEDFPLSSGEVNVEECTIECARHGAIFLLDDGAPLTLPATKKVATYEVRVIDGVVEVVL